MDHSAVVNSVAVGGKGVEFSVSGSDDRTAKVSVMAPPTPPFTATTALTSARCRIALLTPQIWDSRQKKCTLSFPHKYQVLSVAMSESGDMVYTGGIDNEIYVSWGLLLCAAYGAV